MPKHPYPPARLIGDIQADMLCERLLKASRDYGNGEISVDGHREQRRYWGSLLLAAKGAGIKWNDPGQGR